MNGRFLGGLAAAAAIAALWTVPTHTQATQGGNGAGATPTPRLADGHPDLSGLWGNVGGFGNAQTDASGNVSVILNARDGSPENFERDSGIRQRMDPNKPIYKPEFWDKVQDYDINGNKLDPAYSCFPEGVPRMGPPLKIIATPKEIVFLYAGRNVYRVIPIDRPHDPINSLDQTWMGDPVGHWEGDTLVVDTIGFNDVSWLDWPGYFHSTDMRVTERLTREGNTIRYQATVEDPTVLMKPWVMNPRVLRLNTDQNATIPEDLPCDERDLEHQVTKERG
jgi:hypothetical protein